MLPQQGFQAVLMFAAAAVLAGEAQKGHSGSNLGGLRDLPRPASLEHRQ